MNTHYSDHWNDKFLSREWGRYPPEELVRFVGINYKNAERKQIRILEVGCGPGANVWFLHREGFDVSGIDGSLAAITLALQRIQRENTNLGQEPDLRVGNFSTLPWTANTFDVVLDVFAIYANTSEVIDQTISEIFRVLKPGGRFFSKMWGTQTSGFAQGESIEEHTCLNVSSGPCLNMGLSHFFDESEVRQRLCRFQIDAIDTIRRTDTRRNFFIEEIVCEATKLTSDHL